MQKPRQHGIVCEDQDTTKLSIVFDASSKTCNVSLNDCLLKGPNIIPLIFDIILTKYYTFDI